MGCGASAQDNSVKYEEKQSDLQGKARFIGDLGCVVASSSKSNKPSHILSFVPRGQGRHLAMVFYTATEFYYGLYSDDDLEEIRVQQNVNHGWIAVFKSLAHDLQKNKAKVTLDGATVSITIDAVSVKDKTPQKFGLKLKKAALTPELKFKFLIDPLTRMAQCKRCGEERDKELKLSRVATMAAVAEANTRTHREVLSRIEPIIVPLRHNSELGVNIARTQRKISALQRGSQQNELDAMYEHGGARPFIHLKEADEHIPHVKEIDEKVSDTIAAWFPQDDKKACPDFTIAPSDPAIKSLYDSCTDPNVLRNTLAVFKRIDEWDMSVFALEDATNGNALFYTTYALLHRVGLAQHFKINDKVLRNFLTAVQSGYHPNPYHNSTHAADVAQINYYILYRAGLVEKCKLSKEQQLGAVLAGAIHDYDHPGFNNNFHTRTNAYLSTLYNDRSILENHHCACVYEILRREEYNIFKEMTPQAQTTVRDTILEMVLATDMGNHGKYFGAFRRRLGEQNNDWTSKDDVNLALAMSIKMADISNCGRPNKLYLEWAKNIATEFYNQGDAEVANALSVSPFMDRTKDKEEFPRGQMSFMSFVVIPMFEAITELFPPVEQALQHCTENKEYWQKMSS